jgi:hypothetical protein
MPLNCGWVSPQSSAKSTLVFYSDQNVWNDIWVLYCMCRGSSQNRHLKGTALDQAAKTRNSLVLRETSPHWTARYLAQRATVDDELPCLLGWRTVVLVSDF